MLKTIRCLVIDDEPLAIDVIENYLQRIDQTESRRCENALDALRTFQEEKFDMIFLDIEMPLLTGLDFLRTIKNPPPIIVTTAYRDYAVEGFELEVLDYLIKPISFPRFMKAFERAIQSQNIQPSKSKDKIPRAEFLFLKVDRKFVKIFMDDILYIESLKDYIKVCTADASWISYQSISGITEKLPPDRFVRVHRSFTVARDKVKSIEGNTLEIGGKRIPISRDNKQAILKKIIG